MITADLRILITRQNLPSPIFSGGNSSTISISMVRVPKIKVSGVTILTGPQAGRKIYPGGQHSESMYESQDECGSERDGNLSEAEADQGVDVHEDMDLKKKMEAALAAICEFKGSFFFSKTCDAPNPGLHLAEVGFIGLPISSEQAKVVISKCQRAPSGQGPQATSHKGRAWEMDGTQVQFSNPEWKFYLDSMIKEVCTGLGVDYSVSKPRCDLHKLIIYETGSHFLPRTETDKIDNMLARIVVILPSHFTGGEVHLTYNGVREVIDVGDQASSFKTSILSWYSDVNYEMKAVMSGYQLALTFDLIQQANIPPPVIPANHFGKNLRSVFRAWHPYHQADKLIYVLSKKYPPDNLRGNILEGNDAHIVSRLIPIAKNLGFRLGLASLEMQAIGPSRERYPIPLRWDRRDSYYKDDSSSRWDDDDEDEESDRYVDDEECGPYEDEEHSQSSITMDGAEEVLTTIENLVDLDGLEIQAKVDFDEDTEMMPDNWERIVTSGPRDRKDCEGYVNDGGTVTHWYHHTALIIWPKFNDPLMSLTKEAIQQAMKKLQGVNSLKPSYEEWEAVERLLTAARSRYIDKPPKTVRALCAAGCAWKNLDLWLRCIEAFDAGGVISIVGMKGILTGLSTFGFKSMQTTIETMLAGETSVGDQLKLLDSMQSTGGSARKSWVKKQKLLVLRRAKEVVEKDIDPFLEASMELGGFDFFHSKVLPVLRKGDSVDEYSIKLASSLHGKASMLCQSKEDGQVLSDVISDILKKSLAKVQFFKPPNGTSTYYNSRTKSWQLSHTLALEYARSCCQTGNFKLIKTIVKQLTSFSQRNSDEQRRIVENVLIPFLSELPPVLEAQNLSANEIGGLEKLASMTLAIKMETISVLSDSRDIDQLTHLITLGGGVKSLNEILLPSRKNHPWRYTSWSKLIVSIYHRRSDIPSGSDQSATVDGIISDCLTYAIDKSPLQFEDPAQRRYNHDDDRAIDSEELVRTVKSLLETCKDTQRSSHYPRVLNRVLGASVLRTKSKKAIMAFFPSLIKGILSFLKSSNITPQTAPFSTALTIIISTFADRVLGTKPPDASAQIARFAKIGCGCQECCDVVNYLTTSFRPSMKFVVGAPKALHLQTRLSSLGTSVSYALIRKPKQGLEIIREGPVLLHLSWDKRHKEMVEYLHKIGSSDDIQKAVLGVHYRNLMRLLDGENVQVGSPTMTSLPSLSTSRRASNTASSSKEVPKAKDRARVVSDSRQRKRKRSDSEDDEMDDT